MRALDVLDTIATAPSRDVAWHAFVRLLTPTVGPDLSYAFGGLRRPVAGAAGPPQRVVLVTPRLDAWQTLYFGDRLLRRHDPVRLAVRDSIEPVDWGTLEGRPDAPEPEQRLWRHMREAGFKGGLSIPLHEPITGHYGCLSIHLRDDGAELHGLSGPELAALQAAALHFHGALQARFGGAERIDIELSRREREALHWVAGGLVSKAIARRMGLSPYTVDMHIAQAMRKLGARTRSEAASLAFMQGRIAP
jgi:DNA-binding CsgD family transcriptional regulator